MKSTLLFALLLSVTTLKSQDFEGVMHWKIDMQITDPKTKAQMEEAQKKMNDPQQQAQMKEMMEKMNDPQFKAMMEANPQMKAQMEKAMEMMQGGDLTSMIPTGYNIKIKSQNTLVTMEGGMMADSEILFLQEKNTTYKINRDSKTYSILPQSTDDSQRNVETKVTKTSETTKILGYSCTKYDVEAKTDGNTMHQFFWTTTEISGMDFKSLSKMGNNRQSLYYDKVEGIPLRIEMSTPQGKMMMEATSLKKTTLPASDFVLPSGFKEVDFKF